MTHKNNNNNNNKFHFLVNSKYLSFIIKRKRNVLITIKRTNCSLRWAHATLSNGRSAGPTYIWTVALQCLSLTLQLLRVAVTCLYCTSRTVCGLAGTLISISGKTDFGNTFVRNTPPAIYWFYCDVTWCCKEGLCSLLTAGGGRRLAFYCSGGLSPASNSRSHNSTPRQSRWDLFWTKWPWTEFCPGSLAFPLH
jgi:hypothetical protein